MRRLSFVLRLILFASLSSSILSPHASFPASQIDLDRFLSLVPLIDPSSIPSNASVADLAEAAKANNQSESLPNPIAKDYPTQITGTLNASYFVIPIDYAQARAAVPAKYPILTDLIKKLWKRYEKDKYPLVLGVILDHDIQSFGLAIPDFHVRAFHRPMNSYASYSHFHLPMLARKGHLYLGLTNSQVLAFRFPFIDVLNDGHTPYTYLPTNLLDTPLGNAAGTLYGIDGIDSKFTPSKDPYAYRPGANHKGPRVVSAKPTFRGIGEGFSAVFTDRGKLDVKEFDFWKLVLNQPFFGNPIPPSPVTCGVQYKFYDTVVTKEEYAPVRIKGHVSLEGGIVNDFPHGFDVEGLEGARFDVAFLEKNYLDCHDLT